MGMTSILGDHISQSSHENPLVNIISFLLAVIGLMIYSLLIAFVVLLLLQRTSSYQSFRAKIDRIGKEIEYYGLPNDLKKRIEQYYRYLWVHQTRVGSHNMYHEYDLSTNLRSEIAMYLHRDFIKKVPLFE